MSYHRPGIGRASRALESEWLTLGQAAKYLGVAQSTIRKWTDNGLLPAIKTPGKHRRYRLADLDAFRERSQSGAAGTPGPRVLIVDADAGLAALEEEAPDLILLDVMMPQVDGWEMLRRMQERHGVGSIPVLMFSGKVDSAEADEAAKRGASGFIGKPFDPQQLIESAKQMLPA